MPSPKAAKMWEWQKVQEWKEHDNYDLGTSATRVMTRSQIPFVVINHNVDNLEVFADPNRQEPPNMPPLMVTLKGSYGGIPNTVITRSFGKYLKMDAKFSGELDPYKKYIPRQKKKIGQRK